MQLKAIILLQRFLGKEHKEALINSFIFSNFNYCPLVRHFCSCKSSQKLKRYNYVVWELFTMSTLATITAETNPNTAETEPKTAHGNKKT